MEEYMAQRVSMYGISLDVDGLDSDEFPATGTPEIDGCEFEDTCLAIESLDKSKLIGFDIVEYNPGLDQDDFSKNRVLRLIEAFRKIPQ
mmetsp:Transcript_10287/g.1533  ORF Transcript_10287/g.1533 Transcript_10287/m.1533 type:complete len:89 (+) Transcript_10287:593-859(+)|eukprot:CAMPEP_0168314664 /NCGR_PEP_ID=MMETSP0210-20121227/9257_1 /TAXON_ID=40633 /ORGANISM="Condylostoma magnum, Strain COL2" /LENGTH=88 /DNA_ID=CAMNT_0008284627 /DNA_START=588 /DNA_END=854 /DNA_ORIENTATION=-